MASKPATPAARIIILIILNKIYKLLVENLFFGRQEETEAVFGQDGSAASGIAQELSRLRPVSMCSLSEACSQEAVRVTVCEAGGRISARCLYFYPPGIPFLAPGELITDDILRLLAQAGRSGGPDCRGIRDGVILCLRE